MKPSVISEMLGIWKWRISWWKEKCLLESLFLLLPGLKRGLSRSQHYTLVSTTLFCSWQPDTSLTRLSSFAKWVSGRYDPYDQSHLSKTLIQLARWSLVSLSLTCACPVCTKTNKWLTTGVTPIYFLCQRSLIGLSRKRVHSGQIWETKLCNKLNSYLLWCIADSWSVTFCSI